VPRVRHDRDRIDAVAGVGGDAGNAQVVAGPEPERSLRLLRPLEARPPEGPLQSGLVLRGDVIRGTLLGVTKARSSSPRKFERRRCCQRSSASGAGIAQTRSPVSLLASGIRSRFLRRCEGSSDGWPSTSRASRYRRLLGPTLPMRASRLGGLTLPWSVTAPDWHLTGTFGARPSAGEEGRR
jgi:hypothetical protein